jgi:hypothetical protein
MTIGEFRLPSFRRVLGVKLRTEKRLCRNFSGGGSHFFVKFRWFLSQKVSLLVNFFFSDSPICRFLSSFSPLLHLPVLRITLSLPHAALAPRRSRLTPPSRHIALASRRHRVTLHNMTKPGRKDNSEEDMVYSTLWIQASIILHCFCLDHELGNMQEDAFYTEGKDFEKAQREAKAAQEEAGGAQATWARGTTTWAGRS